MNELTIALLALLLLAIVVGMLLVVLLELRTTLRRLRPVIEQTGERARVALDQVEQGARRANRIGQALEGDADLERLAESVRESALGLQRLNQMLRTATAVGSAVGPAVAAFVTVMAERRREEAEPGEHSERTHAGRTEGAQAARSKPESTFSAA